MIRSPRLQRKFQSRSEQLRKHSVPIVGASALLPPSKSKSMAKTPASVFLAFLALLSILSFQSVSAQQRLRIAWSGSSPAHTPIWVVEERGLLKKYGIDGEIISISLERAYQAYSVIFREAPYPYTDGVKTFMDDLAATNPKAANVDLSKYVDMSFLQELESSGFIKQLYKR